MPIDGSAAAKSLFVTRGTVSSLEWSDDGSQLAFVASRGDHSLIGVYKNGTTSIQWIAPAFARDASPRWSPDGSKLAFVRMSPGGGAPDSLLTRRHNPWSIWTAEVTSGKAQQIYKAPATLRGSVPSTHGGTNLHWAAGDKITFLSYQDGWPHLYSIDAKGGKEVLLTPGEFMAEHIRMTPDKKSLVFSANTGPDALDLDRRHVVRVAVDKPGIEVITPGGGLEWTPVVTGDGSTMAFISATSQRPPLPAVVSMATKKNIQLIGMEMIPSDFPQAKLVTPKKVTFKSSDGVTVHADLFEPANVSGKKPAIVYIHGGPPRQMLLGWHYSDYYSNAYASNQYLASLGFVVLSVNYRLGIGYGYEFHQPMNAGRNGLRSTWTSKLPANGWRSSQAWMLQGLACTVVPMADISRRWHWATTRNFFAAGVDIHGVHDYSFNPQSDRYEKAPDLQKAADVAWQSSPIAHVATWTSPVLSQAWQSIPGVLEAAAQTFTSEEASSSEAVKIPFIVPALRETAAVL